MLLGRCPVHFERNSCTFSARGTFFFDVVTLSTADIERTRRQHSRLLIGSVQAKNYGSTRLTEASVHESSSLPFISPRRLLSSHPPPRPFSLSTSPLAFPLQISQSTPSAFALVASALRLLPSPGQLRWPLLTEAASCFVFLSAAFSLFECRVALLLFSLLSKNSLSWKTKEI